MASTPSVWIETLGCAKNQVDSEKVAVRLGAAGYIDAPSLDEADVVLVNTCTFVEAARAESIEAILDASASKRDGARLMVIGCMAERYGDELAAELPEVDAVIGLSRYDQIVTHVDDTADWQPLRLRVDPMDILYEVRRPTPRAPFAYVKVAEGCDKPCTFCAIPSFRGAQRSRPPVDIRAEIEGLVAAGVGEIVLVAQDIGAYGRDIEAPGGLVELLRFVSDVDGLGRLRLLYLHPREIRDGLIEEMTSNDRIASYFDLSLQHVAAPLLRAMKRPGNPDSHRELVARIRSADSDAALRSSFIVGFPGETDDDIDQLEEFLTDARLDWAGFFPYSAEEGTPAYDLPGRVAPEGVAERVRHLESIQAEITADAARAMIGRRLEVLVDGVEDQPVGRSHREAPEIDGVIHLDRGEPGTWVTAEVVGAFASDLDAVVV